MIYSFVCYIAAFEYEVFPVVRKSSNITRISQLHGKKFCHPGYGFETEWTKVISQVRYWICNFHRMCCSNL